MRNNKVFSSCCCVNYSEGHQINRRIRYWPVLDGVTEAAAHALILWKPQYLFPKEERQSQFSKATHLLLVQQRVASRGWRQWLRQVFQRETHSSWQLTGTQAAIGDYMSINWCKSTDYDVKQVSPRPCCQCKTTLRAPQQYNHKDLTKITAAASIRPSVQLLRGSLYLTHRNGGAVPPSGWPGRSLALPRPHWQTGYITLMYCPLMLQHLFSSRDNGGIRTWIAFCQPEPTATDVIRRETSWDYRNVATCLWVSLISSSHGSRTAWPSGTSRTSLKTKHRTYLSEQSTRFMSNQHVTQH